MRVDKNWYFEVNDYCKTLADYFNVPMIQVAGIMSALSPNNTFSSNIKSLEKFLRTKGNCKVTCFNSQKEKAKKILRMRKPTEEKIKEVLGKGLKTRSFFENIYRPDTSMSVTVDLWQIRWAKSMGLIPENGTLTNKRYNIVQDAVKNFADQLEMMPHQFQALTWVKIRGASF